VVVDIMKAAGGNFNAIKLKLGFRQRFYSLVVAKNGFGIYGIHCS